MSNSNNCTSVISENAARDILEQIESVKALAFAMITTLESPLYTNYVNKNAPMTGSGFFIANEKAILRTFGEKINDEFDNLASIVTNLKNFSDLK